GAVGARVVRRGVGGGVGRVAVAGGVVVGVTDGRGRGHRAVGGEYRRHGLRQRPVAAAVLRAVTVERGAVAPGPTVGGAAVGRAGGVRAGAVVRPLVFVVVAGGLRAALDPDVVVVERQGEVL